MHQAALKKLEDLGRSIIGAMMLGLPLLYTMETWWLGWRLPAWILLSFAVGGLIVISLVMDQVGFSRGEREKDKPWYLEVTDFFELLVASFLAGVIVLWVFGIIEWGMPIGEVVRLGLIQIVPLGLGAALTNKLLSGAEQQAGQATDFRKEAAIFAIGAIFFSLPVAPTEEMELMAAHAGPWRQLTVVVLAMVVSYLALFELQFRGRAGRTEAHGDVKWLPYAETATGYVIALVVSGLMLAGYGHLEATSWYVRVQETVVLSFIASVGGSAARVAL